MNELINILSLFFKNSIIIGISSGIVAGFIVYQIINYLERRRWNTAESHVIGFFDVSLNVVLSSLRSRLDISYPKDIKSTKDYIEFIERQLIDKYEGEHKNKILLWKSDEWSYLLDHLNNVLESLKYLISIFVAFPTADPWYLERLFNTYKKIQSVQVSYIIIEPEIRQQISNDTVLAYKIIMINSIKDLCEYVIKTKSNKMVKDKISKDLYKID